MTTSCLSIYLDLLIQAAFASSHMRVLRVIYAEDAKCGFGVKTVPINELQRIDRSHPYLQARETTRHLCEELAKYCRVNQIDPRTSPCYIGIEFKDLIEDILERNRFICCKVLSPAAIYNAVKKRNILGFSGWTICAGESEFKTDAYGLDQLCSPLIAVRAGREPIILWMPGKEIARAHRAYWEITGDSFIGDDGLGEDLPHMYEIYSGL